VAPRRLRSSIRRQYCDIEERIARVTDSKRKIDNLLSALNGPLATREIRMEVVEWIAVCQFNCRIFGGFVRDWIVGGYSSRPAMDSDPSTRLTYTSCYDNKNGQQQMPHLNKEFVPNDIDCDLPDNDFNIDQFLERLHENRSPFTMDLILADSAWKLYKYRILDIDVHSLFVEKDYTHGIGMRTNRIHSKLGSLGDLETVVKNIKNKRFAALRDYDIEDRIKQMLKRGWTHLETEIEDEYELSDNTSNDVDR
ncbi:unnamed protein product, partial [Rotaria sp. Silwood2]